MEIELTSPISWKKTRSRKSIWTGEKRTTSTKLRMMKPLQKRKTRSRKKKTK